jgi:hypothetical protein
LSNLFTKKATLSDEGEKRYYNALKQTLHTPATSSSPTKNAAHISLIKFAEQSKEQCKRVCNEIKSWGIEKNTTLSNLVENLLDEAD